MRRILWMLAVTSLLFSTGCEELERLAPQKEAEEIKDDSPTHEDIEEEEAEEAPIENEEEVITEDTETEEQAAPETKVYVIAQGGHHAVMVYEKVELDTLQFKALFDSTAIYTTIKPENQGDINKLYGMSDCESYHHTNSARFGWRWYEGKLEIWAYTYMAGVRNAVFLDTVALNEYYTYEIQFSDNKYIFLLNGKQAALDRSCTGTAKGYKLFPYFGGDEKAPHDISIRIEELKN